MSPPALPAGALGLSASLAWVNRASRGRFSDRMIAAVFKHYRAVGTDPAILTTAAVSWLAMGCDKKPDPLNQYWHLVDQVSARVRSTYLRMDPEDLIT